MRFFTTLACLLLLVAPLAAQGGEKSKPRDQIEAARGAIEAFSRKPDVNRLAAGDLESARAFLKKGEDALAGGRTMFGLGEVSPEAGQDIKFATDMVELYLALGESHLEQDKATNDLAAMSEQLAKMKARVKVFDDRKAELEKLRASLEKFAATVKELGELQVENGRLAEKIGKLELERKLTEAELVHLKGELAKRDLALQPALPATTAEPGAAAPTVLPAR